jgi:hypothetical protein
VRICGIHGKMRIFYETSVGTPEGKETLLYLDVCGRIILQLLYDL